MAQYELNLSDYFRIIRKRKMVIVATFFITIIGSIFYVSKETPVYQARSTVKIQERKTLAGLLTELVTYSPGDIMESEAKIIKGFTIMKKVARQLGMLEKNAPLQKAYEVVGKLQASISVETIKQTNIIEITAVSQDAKKAVDLANTVAEVYIKENLLEKNKQAKKAREFIEDQLSSIERKLEQNEERLRAFGDEVKGIRVSPSIQSKLSELDFTLLDLLQKYTPKHPAVKQIKSQIEALETQLQGFSGKELEYARLSREVEVNKKLHALLKERLEEARITEAQKVSDISIVNPAVLPTSPVGTQKKATLFLAALTGIVLGIVLVFVFESLDTSIGTIEDVENIMKLPVLGVIPSVKIGHRPAKGKVRFILNLFFPAKKTSADEIYARLIVHHEPKSIITEAYRGIRTNLKLSPSIKTILITSSSPQEGKTTVLTNLGLVIAQAGIKTLLVSSDLRRPAVAKTFGLKEEPGLNEVITKVTNLNGALRNISDMMLGEMKLDRIIETPGIENISIFPSGRISLNPTELLESKEMHNLIDELKRSFDVILFDSPPVLPITDAVLLASKVDGVILVYEAGRTARSALLRTKAQLESAGAKIFGVVLNHIRPEAEIQTNYPYYRYSYTEKTNETGKTEIHT